MSQRFVRCPHCGTPHDARAVVCPTTGRRMRVDGRGGDAPRKSRSSAPPAFTASAPASIQPLTHDEDEAPLIGMVLGNRYKILSILGSGGMGMVYEAEHLGLERQVAVKVLNPVQAKKKNTVKRFQQEARAAGGIGHPNICEVYDMGWLEDGCPYLVMERLHGQTLADRIKKAGNLPFPEIIEVLSQVLAGLMAAHEKGIMHRDIKPENIFLARRTNADPIAKILDFGVSKGMAGGAEEPLDLTRTGMVMGTPYYMSPEQARGERNLDARVDVYACGVMLYECLTGRRPFVAPNYNALLLQILTENPRPARDLRPDLPPAFESVLRRAMARNRDDRYSTAGALRRDLQQLGKQLGYPHEPSGAGRVDLKKDAFRPAHTPQPQAREPQPAPPRPTGPQERPRAPEYPNVRPAAGAPPRAPVQAPHHHASPLAAPSPQAPQVAPHAAVPPSAPREPAPAQNLHDPKLRRQTVRMSPHAQGLPPHMQPQSAQKPPSAPAPMPRRPDLGPAAPPARPTDPEDLPKLFDTSPSADGTPSPHVRPHPAANLRDSHVSRPMSMSARTHERVERSTDPVPPPRMSERKPETVRGVPELPRLPERRTEPDYGDGPTFVISREEILGDFLAGGLGADVSDWDAETTVTTGPPEWVEETQRGTKRPTFPPPAAPAPSTKGQTTERDLRKELEDEYGDMPLDDATLVHRSRLPRRK